MERLKNLPVFLEFEKLKILWESNPHILLKSPTGSGKSLALPYLLKTSGLTSNKILIVQPRRIAARMLAKQVARMADWSLGKEVGYHVRFDKKYNPNTRLVYVTDGIAQAMLSSEEKMSGIEVLILDEFHERSAQIDLCLALALRLWREKRSDLRIIVTSATLDLESLSKYVPQSGSLELSNRSYPVHTEHRNVSKHLPIWKDIANLLPKVLEEADGDVLIFLDGAYAISRTIDEILANSWSRGLEVCPLYGDLSAQHQDKALYPSKNRKIIVSTNIAETSLTIEGVKVVIDSGTAKKLHYDRNRGVNSLVVKPISQSSADQRAGRAGRLGPGFCFRLWSKGEHQKRPKFDEPEIHRIDLGQIYLNLLSFDLNLAELDLFEPIPNSFLEEVIDKLKNLGALNEKGDLTEIGEKMGRLPIHPSWAYALLVAKDEGFPSAIALLLAMLDERPPVEAEALADFYPMKNPRSDPYCLLLAFEEASRRNFSISDCKLLGIHARRCKDSEKVAQSLCSLINEDYQLILPSFEELGQLLIHCFPWAISRMISSGRRIYQDTQGRKLHLSKRSILGEEEFVLPLSIIEKKAHNAWVLQMEWVTGIDESWIRSFLGNKIQDQTKVYLDLDSRKVVKEKVETWRGLTLSTAEIGLVDKSDLSKAYASALMKGDLKLKNWNHRVEKLLNRRYFLSKHFPELGITRLDEEIKFLFLEQLCQSVSTWKEIKNLDVFGPLQDIFSKEEKILLNDAAPEKFDLDNGKHPYLLEYSNKGEVVMQAMLQDLYDIKNHPKIVFGKYPLVVEILAPNRRPVQRTQDLPSFWEGSYSLVRKDLAGRYPKHEWR